jgi:hypothetical protein
MGRHQEQNRGQTVTVDRPEDHDGGQAERIELLAEVDLEEQQDLGPGLTVAAREPARRYKRDTTVPHPRTWPRVGSMGLRKCLLCHCVVPSIKDGTWHLEAMHGSENRAQIDAEEWGEALADELEEYRDAVRTGRARRGGWTSRAADTGVSGGHMAAVLLAVIVVMVITGIIYALANL